MSASLGAVWRACNFRFKVTAICYSLGVFAYMHWIGPSVLIVYWDLKLDGWGGLF